ncbi:MAG: hypothetical protein L0241_22255, partial [Planctomycetia bacterium]|nr:hypothetical protein [Planctomycetia bacterium]
SAQKVDHRADLFSLGVTLYRMATGKLPVDGPIPLGVFLAVTTETPPPVRTLAPTLPTELADLIDRLISKDPAARPQSAAEVATTVRKISKSLKEKKSTDSTRPFTLTDPKTPPPIPPRVDSVPDLEPVSGSLPQLLPTPEELPALDEPTKPISRVKMKRIRLAWLIAPAVCVLVVLPSSLWLAGMFNSQKPDPDGRLPARPPAPPPPKKEEPPKKDEPIIDPDRKAAEFVLSIGGCVSVNGEDRVIMDAKDLPKEPFQLTQIVLVENAPVTDASLAVFKDCRNLTHIALSGTQVGDTGLANFAECKNLMYLYLKGTHVTSAGFATFKDCTQLLELDLSYTQVNNDALTHLKQFKNLSYLFLKETAVNEIGANDLAKALPKCKIVWDGGTIEPKEK